MGRPAESSAPRGPVFLTGTTFDRFAVFSPGPGEASGAKHSETDTGPCALGSLVSSTLRNDGLLPAPTSPRIVPEAGRRRTSVSPPLAPAAEDSRGNARIPQGPL